jgi:hypothetical protein
VLAFLDDSISLLLLFYPATPILTILPTITTTQITKA